MPLNDIDLIRRRYSVGFPIDFVDFIVFSYNEQIFEEKHFRSVYGLINLFKNEIKNDKFYWIEVINRSSVKLPNSIEIFCEYFDIHPLTIEDITTLAAYMKLDLFYDQPAIYLLMKIISWNGQRVEQQQVSFYLKSSQKILITFQEKSTDDQSVFDSIRNRLRHEEQSSPHPHHPLKQMNTDYLFYCLFDAIINRYILVIDEIALRINQFDEKLMRDKQSLTFETFYSIYRLKHDLLHLRILFNPVKDIIYRLQRTTQNDRLFLNIHTDPVLRLDLKHHIVRPQMNSFRHSPQISSESVLNTTINPERSRTIDSLEMQRESVSNLVSLWLNLKSNETQKILKFLMLFTALFMPCLVLIGINSTNYHVQPQLQYEYGYYIVLTILATILSGMIIWYKLKRWI